MLYEFYGDKCPHCVKMVPLIEKLTKEGYKIERLEVWDNNDNAKKMREYDTGLCGGVPFFYNTESKQFICGEADEETLRAWADGKKV